MKIEIKDTVVGTKPSDRIAAVISQLDSTEDDISLIRELGVIKLNEEDEDLDLSHWVRILDRCDNILCTCVMFIPMCGVDMSFDDDHSFKDGVCTIMRFLILLLKRGKKKKYFQSFEHIGQLLRAYDIEVSELAIRVIFYACLPSTSLNASPLEADWKEGVEVSRDIAEDALTILDGLGMLSAEYGFMDYLHGHYPDSANHRDQTFEIKFPATEKQLSPTNTAAATTDMSTTVTIPEYVVSVSTGGHTSYLLHKCSKISNDPDYTAKAALSGLPVKYESTHELALLSVLRAVDGLNGSLSERLRVVCLRAQCLLIISHSRLPHELLHPYMKAGSAVLKDLIALSDISSESFSSLQLETCSYSAVNLFLNSAHGILEFNLRRRGPLLPDILQELGLSRAGAVDPSENTYDSPWGSIVMSASAVATSMLDSLSSCMEISAGASAVEGQLQGEESAAASISTSIRQASLSDSNEDTITDFYAEYVCLAMNLFATCLTTRDSHHIPSDTSVVGAIVGVVACTIAPLTTALCCPHFFKSPQRLTRESEWLLRPLVTALNCLDICISKVGYLGVFRECEGLGPVTDIIEVFGNNAHLLPGMVGKISKSVLDSAFGLLCNVASNTRRTASGPAESGIQVLYQQYFSKLCCQVFRAPFKGLQTTWWHLLVLIRLAIDAEPAFLAQFLRSSYAAVLTEVLKRSARGVLLQSNCEVLIIPLVCLAGSMCITPEGLAFVIANSLLSLAVDILVDSSLVLPQGDGLSSDTISRCGRIIVQTARDHETTRPQIRMAFTMHIEALCNEAKKIQKSLPIGEEPSLSSPRIQILQRLMNLCVVLENMASEGRRQTNDFMKEILTEESIHSLVAAFPCSLPASRQLLAQLSMRHSGIPFFGYYPAAKAITSLLKVAANLSPQSLLPVLFRAVDETLCQLSASKVALRAIHSKKHPTQSSKATPVKSGPSDSEEGGLLTPGTGGGGVYPRRRARSRGGSFGQQGADVLILGVLEYIPHRCMFDLDFLETELDVTPDLEANVYRFLCCTLQLEWLSSMISSGLLPMQRSQGQSLITAGRDVFRRLFAFQRSSLLEVCRFSASKLTPSPMSDCRTKSNPLSVFDSSEDDKDILRVPAQYVLRVLNSTGALIREECEIECSRGIFTASPGSVCVAYERGQTSSGVVRFRTAHGWLSEYRRDQQRDPIMELLSIPPYRATPADWAHHAALKKDPVRRKLAGAMTMRECGSYSMARVHNALNKVAVNLVSLCHVDPAAPRFSSSRAASALSGSASLLSGSLSKIFKSFLTHPNSCLLENEKPKSLKVFSGIDAATGTGVGVVKKSRKQSGAGSLIDKERDRDRDKGGRTRKTKSMGQVGDSGSNSSSNKTDSFKGEDEEEEEGGPVLKENVPIDCAAVCLYFGTVSHKILDPVLCDRNVEFNTYIVRSLSAHGAIDAYLEALIFVLATLTDAMEESQVASKERASSTVSQSSADAADGGESVAKSDSYVPLLSQRGRCALHALTYMLPLLRKLVQRDLYLKSPVTTSMTDLSDDLGPFQMHELLYRTFSSIGKSLLPAFRGRLLRFLPSEVQQEWIGIMRDLICSLQTPLPPATPFIHSPPTGGPINIALNQSRNSYLPATVDAAVASTSTAASASSSTTAHTPQQGDYSRSGPSALYLGSTPGEGQGQAEPTPRSRSRHTQPPAVSAPEQDPVDEIVQSYLQGMGFVRADIELAMQAMQTNETDVVMEYLLNNPRGDDFLMSPEGENDTPNEEPFGTRSTVGAGTLGGVGVGVRREVDDLERAVPDALSALVGDISAVDASEDSLLLVAETSQDLAADDDDADPGPRPGRIPDTPVSAAFGVDQDRSTGTGDEALTQGGGRGADVAGLRRDLGQLISELSRLCVDGDATGTGTGTPAEESALPSLLTVSVPLPVPPPVSLDITPATPPSRGPSDNALDPVPAVQGEYSTPRGPADARLVLQALGRRGLREEDSLAPSLSDPPGDGNDSVNFLAAGLWEQYRQEALGIQDPSSSAQDADEVRGTDIVTKQSQELSDLAAAFKEHSVENVLEISYLGDEISKWGALPGSPQTLIPLLCSFLSRTNEVPGELTRQLPSVYLKLINTLLDRVSDSMLAFANTDTEETPSSATSSSTSRPATSSQLYGTLHLLLCLIRNKKVKAEIDPFFSRKFAESIVSVLLGLISSYGESEREGESAQKGVHSDLEKDQFWPVWISPLCVLLFELVTASMIVSETVTAAVSGTETKSQDQSAALDNSEEKSETLLSEEKECDEVRERGNVLLERENMEEGNNEPDGGVDADVDVDESELSLELGRLVREEVEKSSLLSDATWELIFNAISGILVGSVSLTDCAAMRHNGEGEDQNIKRIRHLDPSSSQGALLLLHTLINKQKLSNRFVRCGGVQTLLALPACSHSADSPSMLSLILQRCMESPAELTQQMMFAIRGLMRPARDSCVTLPAFLNFSTPHLLRAPEEYIAAVMTAVRFVRKVDGETPTVYVELHKKEVLDRRTLKAEAESAIKDPAPDAIALNVLSTLIAYLTEDKAVGSIQRGKSAEKGGGGVGGNGEVKGLNGGDGTELPPHSVSVTGKELRVCVYHRGDVLEALSDCVVVLKRLPVLVAQQIVHTKLHCGQRERKDEFDGEIRKLTGPTEMVSLPDFLIRLYFPAEGTEIATGTSDAAAIGVSEIRSACRFLVTLSTQRGAPRLTVLNALVLSIRCNATASTSSQSCYRVKTTDKEGDEGEKEERGVGMGCAAVEGKSEGVLDTPLSDQPPLPPSSSTSSVPTSRESPDCCSRRLRTLTRLASMVTLVVKASGTALAPNPSTTTHTPQQVSVDVVNHFINTDLPGLFSTALSSVPLDHPLAGEAINAILDPLEMMTRPKLLANLDKLHALAASTSTATARSGTEGAGALGSSQGSGSGSTVDQSGSGSGPGGSPRGGQGQGAATASGNADSLGSTEGSAVGNDESYQRLVEEDDEDLAMGIVNNTLNINTPSDVVSAFEEIQRAVEGAGVVVGDGVDDIYYSRDFGDDEEEDEEDIGIEQLHEDGEEDDDDGDAEEEEEEDEEEGGEHYGIDQDFEDNEEDEDDDDFDSRDDDDEGDQGEDREESSGEGRHPLDGGFEVLQSRRYASSPTTQSALRTARLNRPRGYFDAPYLTGLPSGTGRDSLSDMLPSASVNDMIALEDFGRGAADSAVFVNDHNPFHVNGTRRAGTGASNFVTPPDRIRNVPLRMLIQQLQNDEQGLVPDSDIYNILLNTVPGDAASILMGGEGTAPVTGAADPYNYTVTNSTPGSTRRVRTARTAEGQGEASSLSDLLPGGVDRAIQFRRSGIQHPLLALCDEGTRAGRSHLNALLSQPNQQQRALSQYYGPHFFYGHPSGIFEEDATHAGREGVDLRVGSDLNRILMDETDSIVSAAMAHMPGAVLRMGMQGAVVNAVAGAGGGEQLDARGRIAASARGVASQAVLPPAEVPIAVELLQRHLRDLLVQRLAVNEEVVPLLAPPVDISATPVSTSDAPLDSLDGTPVPALVSGGGEEETDQEVLREIRRSDSESPSADSVGQAISENTTTTTAIDLSPVLVSVPVPALTESTTVMGPVLNEPHPHQMLDLSIIMDSIRDGIALASTEGTAASLPFSPSPSTPSLPAENIPNSFHTQLTADLQRAEEELNQDQQQQQGQGVGLDFVGTRSAEDVETETASAMRSALNMLFYDSPTSPFPFTPLASDVNLIPDTPLESQSQQDVEVEVESEVATAAAVEHSGEAGGEAQSESRAIPCPAGYEPDVFYLLPEFMQQEIADQHVEDSSNDQVRALLESIGYDYDTFSSLPESIRQEILDQARRDQAQAGAVPADPSNSQEMDNASFLVSLSPELRAEVLLTADSAFIASLPPELVAEAQMHRERAAAHWQQRELLQTRLAAPSSQPRAVTRVIIRPSRSTGRPAARSGRPTSFRGELEDQEEEEDDGSEDDDEVEAELNRGTRGVREAGRSQGATLSPAEGLMNLPTDDTERTLAPASLLPILAGLIQEERLPIRSQFLYRLLQNVAKNPRLRDALLRLLVSLLIEDRAITRAVVSELSHGHSADFNFNFSSHSDDDAEEAAQSSKKRAYAVPKTTPKGEKGLSQLSASRLIAVLFHLASANVSVVFDMLCPREVQGGPMIRPVKVILEEKGEAEDNDVKSAHDEVSEDAGGNQADSFEERTDCAQESEGKFESDSAGAKDEAKVDDGAREETDLDAVDIVSSTSLSCVRPSTNSLLEMLLPLFAHPNFTANSADLSELTAFLNVVSAPLEFLGEGLPDWKKSERYQKELKRGAVEVPCVNMSKASLRFLCEVLLSDTCTKNVTDNINAAISRLSIVRANRNVLTELIAEVVVDLASLSQGKLKVLLTSLLAVKKRKNTDRDASVAAGTSSPYRPSVNELPLGEAGGRYHERFLRAMETLDSVAAKTKRSLLDLTPANQLAPTWSTLDAVLTELKAYVLDEDEGKSDGGSRPQSTLNSLLSKLLPVVEGLFLVHVTDILNDGGGGAAATTAATAGTSSSASASAATETATTSSGSVSAESSSGPVEASDETNASSASASASANSSSYIASATVDGDGGDDSIRTLSPRSALQPPTPNSGTGTSTVPGPVPVPASVESPAPRPSILRFAHQALPGERYRNTAAYAALNLSLLGTSGPLGETSLDDRIALTNSRSFRLSQSFQPLLLSHSSSGLGIDFAGNTPLGRAQRLLAFVHSHRAVLNLIVRARPAVLEGSLSALVRVMQLRGYLGFDAKRRYFFSQLLKVRPDRGRRSLHLQLRRGQVFEDSFHQLRMRTAEEMGGRLQVNFHGEEGIDAGGLTREWYLVLSREIFNPNYALFTAAADGATFQPNPLSMINMNHLDYFKFVGRVIGKAICDGQLMDAHFTRSFYKHVLGNPVDYTDLEAIEPEIFKSLKQILNLRLEDLGLELTFSAESHIFGIHEVVDLIPGGRNVAVTDENKAEYIRLVAHHRMTAAIRSQIEAFLEGFYEQVPPELISIFSPTELELVICGLPDVDVDELYANTEYHQYRANDVMILWFWDVLRGFNREEKALFLQFVTGTSKVPLEGFASLQGMRGVQRFSIHKAYGEPGLLPSAHTCFNQLDLPVYTCQEDLRIKLLMAVKEGSEGFGFA